jgi:hypothetical protein
MPVSSIRCGRTIVIGRRLASTSVEGRSPVRSVRSIQLRGSTIGQRRADAECVQ